MVVGVEDEVDEDVEEGVGEEDEVVTTTIVKLEEEVEVVVEVEEVDAVEKMVAKRKAGIIKKGIAVVKIKRTRPLRLLKFRQKKDKGKRRNED